MIQPVIILLASALSGGALLWAITYENWSEIGKTICTFLKKIV